jgi:hypothetical protein
LNRGERLALPALCGIWLAATGPLALAGPAADSIMVAGRGERSVSLGRRHLFAGTDSVYRKGVLLVRDADYAIDYRSGEIYFAAPLGGGDTALVVVAGLTVDVPDSVRYAPDSGEAGAPPTPDTLPRTAASATGAGSAGDAPTTGTALRYGGNKSFSIMAGSGRDLSLDQALNLSASGRISPGLEINAHLSDQNLPLTETGTTTELSQLERMFIQARADRWTATLGDIAVSSPALSLLRLERLVEGAQADIRTDGAAASAAYAIAKGRHRTVRIDGQEGRQGPYRLTADDGTADVRLLANSQKVWLDGGLLQPGAGGDYLIDYDRAELTFTPRRPIGRDSRIVVQYQYLSDGYRRGLTYADGELRLGQRAGIRAAFFQESDDPGRAAGEALSDSQRAALARAGADTMLLWVDGGTQVEPGTGSYVRSDSIYLRDTTGIGNYAVTFTPVGAGRGDYEYDPSIGGFRYVGTNLGGYLARRRLVSPQSSRVAGLRGEVRWNGGSAGVEGSLSQFDRNTLSSIDGGSNGGRAGSARFEWKRDSLDWGGFELRSHATSIGSSYRNPDRELPPDFEARWGLHGWSGIENPDPLSPHRAQEWEGGYILPVAASLGGGWGRLDFPGGPWARKYLARSAVTVPAGPRLSYEYRRHLVGGSWSGLDPVQGRRDLHLLASQWRLGPWGLDAGFAGNTDQLDAGAGGVTGSRYREGSAGWLLAGERINISQQLRRRDDDRRDSTAGSWSGTSYTSTVTSRAELSHPGQLAITVDHTYRAVRFRPGSVGSDRHTHLASLHADHARPDGQVRATVDYSLSNAAVTAREELYLRVPDHTGEYSLDPVTGGYYPDTTGDYRRIVRDQDSSQLAAENSARAYVSLTPSRAAGWWRGLRIDLLGAAAISAPRRIDAGQLVFTPSRLWSTGNLRSDLDLSGDATYSSPAGWNLRARLRWRRNDDNRYAGRHATSRGTERRAEVFLPLPRSVRAAAFAEYGTTAVGTREGVLENGSDVIRAGGDAGMPAGRDLETALKGEFARERLSRTAFDLLAPAVMYRSMSASPYLTRHLGLSGRLRVEAGVAHRWCDRDRSQIPMEFSYTRPLGTTTTWSAQFDYRIGSALTSSGGYDGRKEPDAAPVHTVRFELRAYF